MKRNPVKAALKAGKPQVGTWLSLGSMYATRVLARVGFPWLTVDMEHSPIGIEQAANLFGAIAEAGCVPLARVPRGTHENINGQELDCHVDFNFQLEGGFHRRANLLLYLNKEWDPNWGGAIELHSDPRQPETDQFSEFNVTFNRAVIFETNEYSWHGFRKIQLPQDRLHLSRKCLSIYLYTKERPAHEIAGPHGTFYVQRPFPERFKAGDQLPSERELAETFKVSRTSVREAIRALEAQGLIVSRTGRYKALPILGFGVNTTGLFLMSTMGVDTPMPSIAAYLFVFGFGLGLVMQVLTVAVQNVVTQPTWAPQPPGSASSDPSAVSLG